MVPLFYVEFIFNFFNIFSLPMVRSKLKKNSTLLHIWQKDSSKKKKKKTKKGEDLLLKTGIWHLPKDIGLLESGLENQT